MLLSSVEGLPGRDILQVLGLVRGNTVRSRHIGSDIVAGLRNIVGGELPEYSKLMTEAREEALSRMVAEAEAVGADAVVGVRFATSMITQGAAEILAYGTAVKLR